MALYSHCSSGKKEYFINGVHYSTSSGLFNIACFYIYLHTASPVYMCGNRLKLKDGQEVLSRTGKHRLEKLGDDRAAAWSEVVRVVEEGLGDRKLLVAPQRSDSDSWPLDQAPPMLQWSLNLGLILNPHSAWALLTKVSEGG